MGVKRVKRSLGCILFMKELGLGPVLVPRPTLFFSWQRFELGPTAAGSGGGVIIPVNARPIGILARIEDPSNFA